MGTITQRRITGLIMVVAAVATTLVVVLSGSSAGARTARQITPVPLLSMPRGGFEIALGAPPEDLPLSGSAQTLTLIAGAPKLARAATEKVYVGFTSAQARCGATPATSAASFLTFTGVYSSAHSAAKHAGAFAPNGGAPKSTYIVSRAGVVIHQTGSTRACIWLARNPGASRSKVITVKKGHKKKHKTIVIKAPRSLVSSSVITLENRTFAASVSNLTGASAGNGGYAMYAIDGGHTFRYTVATRQCGTTSDDAATSIAAGTPGSESVAIAAAPCPTDASTYTFNGADIRRSLAYPVSDALSSPSTTLSLGGCELDPLTGASLQSAELYLEAVGCKLGKVEITPYQKTLTRGVVSWAAMNGGLAELAPAKSTVDLVLNGLPATQPAKKSR